MANGTNGNGRSGGRRAWIIIASIIIFVVLVSAFMSLKPRRIRVSVTQPDHEDIASTITTNGKIEPIQNFEAHAPIAGAVRRVLVHEGQQVKAGQELLEMDAAEAHAQLARAVAQLRAAETGAQALKQGGNSGQVLTRNADLQKANAELQAAQRNLDALNRLQQRGAASPAEVQAARDRVTRAQADHDLLQGQANGHASVQEREQSDAELAQARATVAAAEQAVKDATVRAPFAGTVYGLPIKQGSWANAGDLLVQVADISAVQVRAFVDEPEIGKLAADQTVKVAWDAKPGRVWEGKIKSVPSNIVARGTRMVGEVLAAVDNSDRSLLPNTNVNVTIVTASHPNSLTIPREAVRDDKGATVVFVVRDGHLDRKEIKTGVANLTRIEVTSGIADNDTIAVQSLSPLPLQDGISVKIMDRQ